ncbi:VWA domain-containing protein [uncultured Jatrophihabitans sp.]|uniref:VWA domain-containing protein n=1 Tax=uncultured Jatrophihabitans sp. TaxID=1610747 RepID=UPI0035CB7F18
MSLLERQLAFVNALRAAGLTVSVAEGLDAVRAMTALDLTDREQLRAGLAASLVKRQLHRPAFDAAFEVFYPAVIGESAVPASTTVPPPRDPDAAPRGPLEDPVRDRIRADLADYLRDGGDDARLDQLAREAVAAFGSVPSGRPGAMSWSRQATLSRVSPETLMAGLLAAVLAGQERGGLAERRARTMIEGRAARFARRVEADVRRRLAEATDAESTVRRTMRPTLERVAFLGATRAELAALRREIQPLARRLAARLAQDQRRGSRGSLDFRRTIRASLSSGGVPLTTVQRPRRPAKTDLVVLCDVSDSVTSFAHFTLLLVYALREQFSRVRAFAFVDELDEVTRFFAPGGDVLDTVTRLAAEADVTALLGRTDYGAAFSLFEQRFADVVGGRTSLLVLGDARSNYGRLALPALAKLVGRAKHAYWLNPERRSMWDTGDSRASEFAAILPMVECRNLAQLGEFVRDLAS